MAAHGEGEACRLPRGHSTDLGAKGPPLGAERILSVPRWPPPRHGLLLKMKIIVRIKVSQTTMQEILQIINKTYKIMIEAQKKYSIMLFLGFFSLFSSTLKLIY